jgi:hypothetical protein
MNYRAVSILFLLLLSFEAFIATAQEIKPIVSFGEVKGDKVVSKQNFEFHYVWNRNVWGTSQHYGETKRVKAFAILVPTNFTKVKGANITAVAANDIHILGAMHYRDNLYYPLQTFSKDILTFDDPDTNALLIEENILMGYIPQATYNPMYENYPVIFDLQQFYQIDVSRANISFQEINRLEYHAQTILIPACIPYKTRPTMSSFEAQDYFHTETIISGWKKRTSSAIEYRTDYLLIDKSLPSNITCDVSPMIPCNSDPAGINFEVRNLSQKNICNLEIINLTAGVKDVSGLGNLEPTLTTCSRVYFPKGSICGPAIQLSVDGVKYQSIPIDCESEYLYKPGFYRIIIRGFVPETMRIRYSVVDLISQREVVSRI